MIFLSLFSLPLSPLYLMSTNMKYLYRHIYRLHRQASHCRFYHSHRSVNESPTFITTPIFYVNADPHIGHLYSVVYADAIARFSRLQNPGKEIIFSAGTDEHGLKIQRSAEKLQQNPQQYCDKISANFRSLFDSANISYTVYNRTTDEHHKRAVTKLWSILLERGYIYKSTYAGYYSVSDECFVPDNLITEKDGNKFSTESGHQLEWHKEDNYMFRLSALQGELENWIDNRLIMKPENFHTVLKADIKNAGTLYDISISRVKSRLKWGIDVPGDSSQVIYVWFDALINYLTAAGFPDQISQWPAAHLIGKDILKFHAIFWPAFLLGAGLEPPNIIYCHSHWLYEDHKMSKSKGNVVDPRECLQMFGVDGIRYFLLKEGTPHSDSNFSMEKVKMILNADLANTYGNLLSRCTSIKVNPRQHYPTFGSMEEVVRLLPETEQIIELGNSIKDQCKQSFLDGSFYIGISTIFELLHHVNGLINLVEPWKLAKNPEHSAKLDACLFVSLESLRIASILLSPITPGISEMVARKLNLVPENSHWNSAKYLFNTKNDRNSKAISAEKALLFSKLQI